MAALKRMTFYIRLEHLKEFQKFKALNKDSERSKKMKSDEKKGYRDRLSGYYDKWYRYNRKDDGEEYDRGCVKAVDSGKCPESFTIIDCA